MKKKRILKDPDTGEIVGATRTPFSRQAKELNKQIFAEEFEKNRLDEELPEETSEGRGYLFFLILLGLAGLGAFAWLGAGDDPPVIPKPSSIQVTAPIAQTVPVEKTKPEVVPQEEKELPELPVQTRVVDESIIQYRGPENLIFLPNSVAPFSGVVQSFWSSGQKSKEFSVVDGKTQGSIGTWYENGQTKEDFITKSGKVVSVKVWKPNGEKCPVSLIEEGNGVYVWYMPDGSEKERIRYENGQPVVSEDSAVDE
jgi:hypothetical protein